MATASTLLRLGLLLALVPPSLTVAKDGPPAPRQRANSLGRDDASGAASVSGQVSCEQNDEIEVVVKLTQGGPPHASSRGRCEASLYGSRTGAAPGGRLLRNGAGLRAGLVHAERSGGATHQWCPQAA